MKVKKQKIKIMRSFISVILVIMIVASMSIIATSALSYSGSSSYKSGKYYSALTKVTLTGNQRTDIVNVAKSQIGYQEGSSSSQLSGEVRGNANYTEYGRWYGIQDMWCAMFVSWCANVAGVSTSIVPKHSYTPTGLSWFKNKGQAYSRATVASGGYKPQPGDIIYFKSSRNSNSTNHIGIVTSYSGGTVYTIEGNTSSATVSTNGGAVAAKSYSISNTYIVYICKPSYNGSSSTTPSTSSGAYYPACSSSCTSIVAGLNAIGVDSSYSFRSRIAAANGISGYSGTADQNTTLLNLLKAGKLINPNSSTLNGWVQNPSGSGIWYYYVNGAMQKNTWKFISDQWYYFNSDGTMATKWKKIDGKWYYLYPSTVGNHPKGSMVTGWYSVDGKWYYFHPTQTGSFPTGSMAVGWTELSNTWYYFYESTSGSNPEGSMATGWLNIGNKWYYFLTSDAGADDVGKMATGWIFDDKDWYYLYTDADCAKNNNYVEGAMATGWIEIENEWYYLNSSGAMQKGFITINSDTYYLYTNTTDSHLTGSMATGDLTIDGIDYTFNSSGKLINTDTAPEPTEPTTTAPVIVYYPACDSSFTTLSDALTSIGVDSTKTYRTIIAIANGIDNYTGTAEQNNEMLKLLKAGKLINPGTTSEPTESTTVPVTTEPATTAPVIVYYPACDSSYTSLSDALTSINVDCSKIYRTTIAAANGIDKYTGTVEENTALLNLLKAGKLVVPVTAPEPTTPAATEPSASNPFYFPACDDSYTTISAALTSIGVNNTKEFRSQIAAVNGIDNYTGTAEQNNEMLNLLKAGKLVNPQNGEVPVETQPSTQAPAGDYSNYSPNSTGDGKGIYAYGVDISKWQGDGIDFYELKDGGIDYVIMRAGYRNTIDPYFEYNYSAAKEAGLDVGAYWYSYATTAEEAISEANTCAEVLGDRRFEYPIYFDFEDPTQMSLPSSTKSLICNTWMKNMADRGYLVGLYSSYSEFKSDLNPAVITPGYESWMARYLSTGSYETYTDYHQTYGMWQYTSNGVVKGYSGNIDRNISFKDYPSIVKQNGYNNYSKHIIDDFEIANLGESFYSTVSLNKISSVLSADSSNVTVSTLNKNANQIWKFVLQDDETYRIVNAFSKENLEITSSGEIRTSKTNDVESQSWYIIKNSDNTLSIMPINFVADGKVININHNNGVELSSISSSDNQKFSVSSISDYQFGDINLDGTVDISDVTALQKIIVEISELNEDNKVISDVNFDNNIDVLDVTKIQSLLAGIITEF